jgi:hypothetical protein
METVFLYKSQAEKKFREENLPKLLRRALRRQSYG